MFWFDLTDRWNASGHPAWLVHVTARASGQTPENSSELKHKFWRYLFWNRKFFKICIYLVSWLRQDAKAMLHAASNIHEMMLWLFFYNVLPTSTKLPLAAPFQIVLWSLSKLGWKVLWSCIWTDSFHDIFLKSTAAIKDDKLVCCRSKWKTNSHLSLLILFGSNNQVDSVSSCIV